MHTISTVREASSTRGFVTLDPERQGVLVTQRRRKSASEAVNAQRPRALQTLHQQDAASRFDHQDPIKHTHNA
jgi:hypothetical protein